MSDAALSETSAARAKPAGLKALIQSLLINILGPYIVFTLAEPHFPANSTTPLLLSALVPAIEFTILYWRQRVVDVIAIISLVQLTGSVAVTLWPYGAWRHRRPRPDAGGGGSCVPGVDPDRPAHAEAAVAPNHGRRRSRTAGAL